MAQPFLNRRKVFLGAVQTGETIEILDAADGGLLIKEAASTALELVNNDRSDVARDTLSNVSNVMGSKAMSISLEGELIPSGSVSTLPTLDPVLRSCGLARSVVSTVVTGGVSTEAFKVDDLVTGGTSAATGRIVKAAAVSDITLYLVVLSGTFQIGEEIAADDSTASAVANGEAAAAGFEYKPVSTNMNWGTFSLWEDDYQKTIHSAMGTIAFNLESSLVGSFTAELKGPITKDETTPQWGDGTMPSPTFSSQLPSVLHAAQLKVADVGGANAVTSIVGQTIAADAANDVQLRRDLNDATGLKGAHIPSRAPTLTLGVEYLTDAQYAVYDKLFDNEDAEVSYRLGDGTAGETIEFYGKVNFNNVGVGDENGLATQSLECSLIDNEAVGDSEYKILFL